MGQELSAKTQEIALLASFLQGSNTLGGAVALFLLLGVGVTKLLLRWCFQVGRAIASNFVATNKQDKAKRSTRDKERQNVQNYCKKVFKIWRQAAIMYIN